jgi:hypothetical protein
MKMTSLNSSLEESTNTKRINESAVSESLPNSKRLSLICADLGKLPRAAFEYLVLNLNTRQKDVEFQFIPIKQDHPFLLSLSPGSTISVDDFEEGAAEFIEELEAQFQNQIQAYRLPNECLGRPLIVSLARLDARWYEMWKDAYSALFLGDWDLTMAPPSILESLLSLIMVEGLLYIMLPDKPRKLTHLPTRGCLGDFNATLRDVRYKTLQGFLCKECRSIIENSLGVERTIQWTNLLDKTWLGNLNDPTSPASVVAKLGYNLFVTKGLAPTKMEKLFEKLKEDGVKELLKLVGGIVLALLLFWLGLK